MPTYMASRMINENVRPNIRSITAIKGTFDSDTLKKKCLWLPSGDRMSWSEIIGRKMKIDSLTDPIVSAAPAGGCFSKLDHQMYRLMHDCFPEMTPALASRQEVWNTINVGLFPHIIVYRWRKANGDLNNERFISSNRNYFGSMWWRAFFFYDSDSADPYWILDNLNEDDFVQIMERVKLRGYPSLAKSLGKKIVEIRRISKTTSFPQVFYDVIIRQSIVDLRVQALGADFNSISDISSVVDETFERITEERKKEYYKSSISFITRYKKSK